MPDVAAPAAPDVPADRDGGEASAQRVFSVALLVSGVRCLLTYLVLPFAAPALGLATGVGPALGMTIGAVAIGANGFSIRRFHRARHRWRWHYTVMAAGVIGLLSVLLVQDLVSLM